MTKKTFKELNEIYDQDKFLYQLESEINRVKEQIEGKLGWVKSATEQVERNLNREDDHVVWNSLGEFQSKAQAVDVEIGQLSQLLKLKKEYIAIKKIDAEKEV